MKSAFVCIIAATLFITGCNPSGDLRTPSGDKRFTTVNIEGAHNSNGGGFTLMTDSLTGREFIVSSKGGILEIKPKEEK